MTTRQPPASSARSRPAARPPTKRPSGQRPAAKRPAAKRPAAKRPTPPSPIARWLPAIAAAGVLGVVVIAGLSGGSKGGAGSIESATSTPSSAVGADSVNAENVSDDNPGAVAGLPVQATVAGATGSTVAGVASKTVFATEVRKGAYSDDVKLLQQRLTDLHFAPGPVDGSYGDGTEQAVWAYKKLVMKISRAELSLSNSKSLVTPEMWSAMQDPQTIAPRRALGTGTSHVEIYLPEQVLIVFTDDAPVLITHIASGTGEQWCEIVSYDTDNKGQALEEPVERDECGISNTPGGVFKFYRRYDGNRQGPLGGMYNPVYFNYGIAVHGAKNVPLEPASHGCIRVNMAIAEYFPDLVENGDRVYVWGEDGKEPEGYTKRETIPTFNFTNPDASSTTSSSTSTTEPKPTTADATATTAKQTSPSSGTTPTATSRPPTAATSAPVTVAPTSPPATQSPATQSPATQAPSGPAGP